MKEIIHLDSGNAGKLCCDNPQCGYELPAPLVWNRSLVGYECPKCQMSMLTIEDYLATEKTFKWIRWINRWFGWLGHEYIEGDPKNHKMTMKHLSGRVIVKRE